MERVYESGAAAGVPAAPAAPSTGYPTAGDPGLGVDATKPGPYWFHMITAELRAVIAAAGITPNHLVLNQLLLALQGGFGLAKSLTASGYIKIPGGLILQWGRATQIGDPYTVTFPLAFPTEVFTVYTSDLNSSASGGSVESAVVTPSMGLASFQITGSPSVFAWFAIGY